MATSASITVKNKSTGKYDTIYLHYDGYLEDAFAKLNKFYNNYVSAQALVDLGDISSLQETINCPHGHTMLEPANNCSVFYERDQEYEPEDTGPQSYNTLEEVETHNDQEYNYLFENDIWSVK